MKKVLWIFFMAALMGSGSLCEATTNVTFSARALENRLLGEFRKTGNVNRLRAEAGTAYKRHKKEPVPAYLLAYAEFRSGNHAGAVSLAEEAARLADAHPGEKAEGRYRLTVQNLKEGSPAPFIFDPSGAGSTKK